MVRDIEELILDHLRKIRCEQTQERKRDREMMIRLAQIEKSAFRIGRMK